MPALSNPKHEAFCQAYVRGPTAGIGGASYLVGRKNCTKPAAAVAANRLIKTAKIANRIAELQQQVVDIEVKATAKAADKLGITKEKVLGELAKLGFSNMLDYVRPTEEGDVEVDLSRLERDTAAAITEVVVDTYLDGRGDEARTVKRVRFKLADKRAALVDIGKFAGYFNEPKAPPPAAVNVTVNAKAELVDRPPRETFKQWEARRAAELAAKQPPRKPEKRK